MGKIFKNDVSVLFNNNPISEDFHLYECGYEECKPTKPYEFVPIDYWVIHYCIAGEGIFQIEDKQSWRYFYDTALYKKQILSFT